MTRRDRIRLDWRMWATQSRARCELARAKQWSFGAGFFVGVAIAVLAMGVVR